MTTTSTITENPASLREVLAVYNVHESGTAATEEEHLPANHVDRQSPLDSEEQGSWPSDWRRMPQYRPTSRSHRVSDRPGGQTAAERGIVAVMFSGVWMIGVWQAACRRLSSSSLTGSTVC